MPTNSNQIARALVSAAIKKGTLAQPYTLKCADCGDRADVYDHRDYNSPFKIEPVCQRHNGVRGPGKNAHFAYEYLHFYLEWELYEKTNVIAAKNELLLYQTLNDLIRKGITYAEILEAEARADGSNINPAAELPMSAMGEFEATGEEVGS